MRCDAHEVRESGLVANLVERHCGASLSRRQGREVKRSRRLDESQGVVHGLCHRHHLDDVDHPSVRAVQKLGSQILE
jgi:hypothetical protein